MAVPGTRRANERCADEQDRSEERVQDLRPARRCRAGPYPPGTQQGRSAGADRLRGRRQRPVADHRCWRDLRDHGPVGFRQVDPGAPFQPPDRPHQRRDPGGWRGHPALRHGSPPAIPPAQDQHGVPEFRPAAAQERARQCRLRPEGSRRKPGAVPRAGPALDRHGGPEGLREVLSAPAFRRHASVSAWPARWPPTPRSFSWTRPSAPSTR